MGYKGKRIGVLEATRGVVLAMQFLVVALLGAIVAVAAVFLMYVLGRRWM